jgi:hypothetical protein
MREIEGIIVGRSSKLSHIVAGATTGKGGHALTRHTRCGRWLLLLNVKVAFTLPILQAWPPSSHQGQPATSGGELAKSHHAAQVAFAGTGAAVPALFREAGRAEDAVRVRHASLFFRPDRRRPASPLSATVEGVSGAYEEQVRSVS